jgi:type VI protein secretion system component VasK
VRRIRNALTSRWVLTAFGLFAAGSMVWLFGPLTMMLDGVMPRIAVLAIMSFVWIGAHTALTQMRQRTDARLSAGVTQAPTGAVAGAEDVEEQRERLTRAMRLLREARGTRGYCTSSPGT